MSTVKNSQKSWDTCYASLDENSIKAHGDPWLGRWHNQLETAKQEKILDLGCGSGKNSRFLTECGYSVVAVDFSQEALKIGKLVSPQAFFCRIDIREPLPFPDKHFQLIVADLSLHYFYWSCTQKIVCEINRILKNNGFLFARVNSTKDINYGAKGHKKVEHNLRLVDGELKRFFDKESIEELFRSGWEFHGLEEMTVKKYEKPKVLWEIILKNENNKS